MTKLTCPYCGSLDCRVDYDLVWKDDRFPKYQIASCAGCDIGFVLPLPTQEELDHLYNSLQYHSQDRSTINFSEADPSLVEERILKDGQILQKYVPYIPASGSVLDIGSGWGTLLKYFSNQGFETTGIELSVPTSSFAREQLGLEIYNLPVERISEIPLKSYNLITMRHVLEHFYHPQKVLLSLHDRLSKNGRIIIEVPDYGSYDRKSYGEDWPAFGPYHLWYFTRPSLSRVLEEAGFKILLFHTFMSDRIVSGKSSTHWLARKLISKFGGRKYLSGRSIGLIACKQEDYEGLKGGNN